MNTLTPAQVAAREAARKGDGRFGEQHLGEGSLDIDPAVTREVSADGTVSFRNTAGHLHRDDGPAALHPDGTEFWFQNNLLHRDDGPAVVGPGGRREWWRNGKVHRDDGPAIESASGTRAWYRHGLLHRDDGPAIEASEGTRFWYRDGRSWYPDEITDPRTAPE